MDDDSSVELVRVGAVNWTDQTVTVHVRVHYDEEVVEEVTYEFEPDDDGRVLDCTWPSEPGNFALSARLEDDDEWEKRDLTDPDSDCAAAYVYIGGTVGSAAAISMPISRDCDFYANGC